MYYSTLTLYTHKVLPDRRSVVTNDDKLSLALAKTFQCLPVPKAIFATLHNKSKPSIDALGGLLLQVRIKYLQYLHVAYWTIVIQTSLNGVYLHILCILTPFLLAAGAISGFFVCK